MERNRQVRYAGLLTYGGMPYTEAPKELAEGDDYLCSAATCIETIELTNDEYERARFRPTVFVLVPGHQKLDVERVVAESERVVLVEKVVAVEEIIEADPRSD